MEDGEGEKVVNSTFMDCSFEVAKTINFQVWTVSVAVAPVHVFIGLFKLLLLSNPKFLKKVIFRASGFSYISLLYLFFKPSSAPSLVRPPFVPPPFHFFLSFYKEKKISKWRRFWIFFLKFLALIFPMNFENCVLERISIFFFFCFYIQSAAHRVNIFLQIDLKSYNLKINALNIAFWSLLWIVYRSLKKTFSLRDVKIQRIFPRTKNSSNLLIKVQEQNFPKCI